MRLQKKEQKGIWKNDSLDESGNGKLLRGRVNRRRVAVVYRKQMGAGEDEGMYNMDTRAGYSLHVGLMVLRGKYLGGGN